MVLSNSGKITGKGSLGDRLGACEQYEIGHYITHKD